MAKSREGHTTKNTSHRAAGGAGSWKQRPQEWAFVCLSTTNVHDADKPFFEVSHLYVLCRCHFSCPCLRPFRSSLCDPQSEAVVQKNNSNPKHDIVSPTAVSLSTTREHHLRRSIPRASGFKETARRSVPRMRARAHKTLRQASGAETTLYAPPNVATVCT